MGFSIKVALICVLNSNKQKVFPFHYFNGKIIRKRKRKCVYSLYTFGLNDGLTCFDYFESTQAYLTVCFM